MSLLFENLDPHAAFFANGLGFVGDPGRGHDVGRMIAEIADEDGGFCRRHAAPDAFTRFAATDAFCGTSIVIRPTSCRLMPVFASIDRELVTAENRAFRHGLRHLETQTCPRGVTPAERAVKDPAFV